MEITDKDIAQLESFWQGSLPDKERRVLENRLNTDAEFRKEANKIRLFTEGLAALRQRAARQRLTDLDATLPPIEPPNSGNWWKIAFVALVLALAAFGVWFLMNPISRAAKREQPNYEIKAKLDSTIVIAYFETYDALDITRGNEMEDIKTKALRTYASHDFEAAIPLLEMAFQEDKNSFWLFYKGIALIGNGESTKAVAILESLQTNEALPKGAASWYLALAYIESGQSNKALQSLQALKDTNQGRYTKKAKEILKELKKY